VNPTCRIKSTLERTGDLVLDLAGTLRLNIVPSGFPFFQSFYALRNGVNGEQWIVETRSPDMDKILEEPRMNDGIIELSTRTLACSYVAGMQIGKEFNYEFIRKSKEGRGHRRWCGRRHDPITNRSFRAAHWHQRSTFNVQLRRGPDTGLTGNVTCLLFLFSFSISE